MTIRSLILGGALTLALATTAYADGLLPRQALSIDLGEVSGVAYYTAERSGYRVVATLAGSEGSAPIRFEALLGRGQSVTFSTPRGVGLPADTIEISREDDTMSVRKAAAVVTH